MNIRYIIGLFRSLVFNLVLLLIIIFNYFTFVPLCLINRKYAEHMTYFANGAILIALRLICGVSYRVEGELPKEPCIIISNHNSSIEIAVLSYILKYARFVVKEELLNYPFFGIALKLSKAIPVENDRKIAIRSWIRDASRIMKDAVLNEKRQVVIFPEGQRVLYSEDFKSMGGINFIHRSNNYTNIYPIVHDAGKFCSLNLYGVKYPGVITFKVLEPIKKDVSPDVAHKVIEEIFKKEKL
jgi:1-acyl-sn-glycerol-3-phosphate acyltransferase